MKRAPEGLWLTKMEGPVGLEPTTPCLKGRCSNQLSYGPAVRVAGELTPYIIRFYREKSI
jgi:hypothetical protein